MNKNLIWAKTLLTVYRYLERIAGAIDKIILQSGLNSANISGQNYYYNNVMSISQKLINLSERKITIINLKVLIEDVLQELEKNDTSILMEKYLDGMKTREIMIKHDISLRTAFRRLEHALGAFSECLIKKGYNNLRLSQMLEKEGWINNCHQRLLCKEDDLSLSGAYLARAVSM